MKPLIIDALLALAVACTWLGCIGFLRLRDTLDRLHCVAFVNVCVSVAVAVAALVGDGVSPRSLKVVLIALLTLLAGAAGTHVTGRALLQRGRQ